MLISYNWIKSYLPEFAATPAELAESLTMHSFETEVASELIIDPSIIVAKISQLEPHPNADRLRLATIDTGADTVTVICGAPNIAVGQLVPYSPPGTKLRDDTGQTFTVKEATIRGVSSPGMLNSLRELDLGRDHAGIWLLPDDLTPGTPLSEHVPNDTILEIDLTPNRAHDCYSHIGIAREAAAIYQLAINEPELPSLPEASTGENFSIELSDPMLAPRYLGALVDNLTIKPSPLWLQTRLIAAGGKPINNVVDITNYVMFEYGNPTHLFDSNQLPGQNIGVRQATNQEKITTLDEEVRELSGDDLVITANNQPIALAGVIGGHDSEVTATSTTGLLEVANFNAFRVQETSRRLNLRTEASLRFSKRVDPNTVELAARRAIQLLQEHASATVHGIIDQYPHPHRPQPITFHPERVTQVAGAVVADDQIREALTRLRCVIEEQESALAITPPSNRLDLTGEHDLIEEVIRITGLDNIAAAKLPIQEPQSLPHHLYWREAIRDTLVSLGFTETYNASFEHERYAVIADTLNSPHIAINNPPTPEQSRLRTSLLPGLLVNLASNREELHRTTTKENALFEIGHVFRPGDTGQVPGVIESEHLAGVIIGSPFALADVAEKIASALNLDSLELANVLPATVQQQLKYRLPLVAFEINLADLTTQVEQDPPSSPSLAELTKETTVRYTPIIKFPAAYRDLSILINPKIAIEEVQAVIERSGGELVVDVDLFDDFQPDQETKSLAFHIKYQATDRTLTDEEVNQLHNQIVATLQSELAAKLRS